MKQLTGKTKALYGLGFSARGIKDGLFQLCLFFYFERVLGLDPALAGLASLVSLIFDAVTDPIMGLISDKWQSKKWGRRHPFMFLSAVPMGVFTWLLFAPPAGLEEMELFWWMLVFSVLVRLSLTIFQVPAMSLGAEMTTDYKERTSLTAVRIMFASFFGAGMIIFGVMTYFTPDANHSNGLMRPDAYPQFAFVCGILMIITILLSTYGTRNIIPDLAKPTKTQTAMSVGELLQNLKLAIKMKSFNTLVIYSMLVFVGLGVGIILTPYFIIDLFELSEKELAILPVGSAIGGILSMILAPKIGEKLDKKWGAFYSTILFGVFFTLPFNARLLGIFPENGSPNLVLVYTLALVVAYLFLWISLSLANSMMADVVDEFETIANTRQEGLFFATMSFAYKCTTGLGQFIAGLLLTWIAIPKQAEPGTVPEEALHGLGLSGGPVLLTFYMLGLVFIAIYPITKQRYLEIRKELDNRKAN